MPGPARYREAQRANALRSGFYGYFSSFSETIWLPFRLR